MTPDKSWDRFLASLDEYNKAKALTFISNLQRAVLLDKNFNEVERKKFEEKCRVFWEKLNGQYDTGQ